MLIIKLSINRSIRIIRIIVSEVLPVSKEARRALEARKIEELERAAQVIEGGTVNDLINLLMRSREEGGEGLSHGDALVMAKLIIGKASEKMQTIRMDSEDGGRAVVASILEGGLK